MLTFFQDFCDEAKAAFGDVDDFGEHGGLKGMGDSLDRGNVSYRAFL